MNTKRCSRCARRQRRQGQRWCRECFTEYERLRRADPIVRARVIRQWRESWARQTAERKAAKSAVYCAVKTGRLKPPKRCSGCGRFASRIHGHHEDYSRPLGVRWLCPRCHGSIHTLSA